MKNTLPSGSDLWGFTFKVLGSLFLGYSLWFCLLLITLRWINPAFTSFTLREDWDALERSRYDLTNNWVSYEDFPEHLTLALIASEDQRFREHWGLDTKAIKKAISENKSGKGMRGASTITQQVAKNLFLSSSQNYARKGVEAVITLLIESFWTKDRILEVYLNIAEFGPGMFGISKASEFYYDIQPSQLNAEQSARLITVLPSPKRIEAEPASDYVKERSTWILENMERMSGLKFLPDPKPFSGDSLKNWLDNFNIEFFRNDPSSFKQDTVSNDSI